MKRENTKSIKVGNLIIGGQNKVIIQTMLNIKTSNHQEVIKQINLLEQAGCQMIRVSCLDFEDTSAIKIIKSSINIPLVADIHFDYRLALAAIDNGVDKIRLNPGNLDKDKIKLVVKKCQEKNIPIRIGINGGSLEKDILAIYGQPNSQAMIESAKRQIKILEELNFTDIILSLKSSNLLETIKAYQIASELFNYPLHIGISESGSEFSGLIKSSAGLSILINEGIGDTIRISLTADPLFEIRACKELLKSFNLYENTPNLISCPTCGRTQINIIKITHEIEDFLVNVNKNIKVAIMGCVVNGPGEASDADIGIAGGNGRAVLFKKGKIVKAIKESEIIEILKKEIIDF